MVVDLAEQKGEIGEADKKGPPLADDGVILAVDLEGQVLGSRASGRGENKVGIADDLAEEFQPLVRRRRDMVDRLVGRKQVRAFPDLRDVQPSFDESAGLLERGIGRFGQTRRWSYETHPVDPPPGHGHDALG
jgi:hypothetical protein